MWLNVLLTPAHISKKFGRVMRFQRIFNYEFPNNFSVAKTAARNGRKDRTLVERGFERGIRAEVLEDADRIRESRVPACDCLSAAKKYLPRVRALPIRQGKGRHPRARPLPRRKPGEWSLLCRE